MNVEKSADERREFAEMIAAVYSFYRVELSDAALAIWWGALEPYDLLTVRAAFSRHVTNPDSGQFLPKPADVVREIAGTTADASALAWSKVVGALRDHGTYESVAFDDAIIHAVLTDLGGWPWLGEQKTSEMGFIEKRFRDGYRARLRSAFVSFERVPTQLPGRVEIANARFGRSQTPKLVGDRARALAISRGEFQPKVLEKKP